MFEVIERQVLRCTDPSSSIWDRGRGIRPWTAGSRAEDQDKSASLTFNYNNVYFLLTLTDHRCVLWEIRSQATQATVGQASWKRLDETQLTLPYKLQLRVNCCLVIDILVWSERRRVFATVSDSRTFHNVLPEFSVIALRLVCTSRRFCCMLKRRLIRNICLWQKARVVQYKDKFIQ